MNFTNMSFYRNILRRHNTILNGNNNQLKGIARIHNLHRIGKREVVGYGLCGSTTYVDTLNCPMPAIRFQEFKPEHEVWYISFNFCFESAFYFYECLILYLSKSLYARENAATGSNSRKTIAKHCIAFRFAKRLPRCRRRPACGRDVLVQCL